MLIDRVTLRFGDVYDWQPGSQPVVLSNDLYRSEVSDLSGIPETVEVRIKAGLPAGETYQDIDAASGVEYSYRAVAIGDNTVESTSESVVAPLLELRGSWLHVPRQPDTLVHYEADSGRQSTEDYRLELRHFQGRRLPVAEFGEEVNESVALPMSFLREETELMEQVRGLVRRRTIIGYRDARGRKMYGVFSGFPRKDERWGTESSLVLVAVAYTEGE